ncbi:CBS domain-containing protein [Nostoc sp. CHAB 5834]|nr:CBS domain-containing protein [Nostoc sp. CHAB 5834]
MIVADLLNTKGTEVISISEDALVATAVGIMAASRIGALVVEDSEGALIGLFSERELIIAVSHWGGGAGARRVADAMVRLPATVEASDTVDRVMALMTHRRTRHVPVVQDGRVSGILSIGDVLKSRLDEKTLENAVLRDMAKWNQGA